MPKAERQARGSHEQTMKEGRYIGHHGRTGPLLVMTAEGILRGSCARRMREESRWSTGGWGDLKGHPWDIAPEQKGRVPKFGVRRRRRKGTVASEADICTTTVRTTHVHHQGGREQVRTD